MKIYNELIYDLKTGSLIEESFFEYEGIIAECKGGSSSTTSVDPEYNKRMAAIAEAQQSMAEEYFNYYKYGPGHYDKPDTSRSTWEAEDSQSSQSYEDWVGEREGEWERTWIPDEGAVGLQQYEQEQMKSAMKLLPGQMALAGRHMDITGKYFDKVAEGADVRGEMGRAKTDVRQAYAGMEGEMRRSAGRMGGPSSGRFAGMQSKILRDKTKALAGAGTMGRRYAEEKQFERLKGAMQ